MKQKGFTLIELLVVVAIIGILTAVGVVAYNGYTASAKSNATKQNLNSVVKKLQSEKALCEVKSSNDTVYVGGDGNYRGITCDQMIYTKGWPGQVVNAVTTYHQNLKNLFNSKRPGISTACNDYEKSTASQESFIGTIWFCQTNTGPPYKVEVYSCIKTPCSDSNNHFRKTVNW